MDRWSKYARYQVITSIWESVYARREKRSDSYSERAPKHLRANSVLGGAAYKLSSSTRVCNDSETLMDIGAITGSPDRSRKSFPEAIHICDRSGRVSSALAWALVNSFACSHSNLSSGVAEQRGDAGVLAGDVLTIFLVFLPKRCHFQKCENTFCCKCSTWLPIATSFLHLREIIRASGRAGRRWTPIYYDP